MTGPSPGGKACTACGRFLLLTAFHRDAGRKRDGRHSICADCRCAARRKPGGRGPRPALVPESVPRRCTGPCGRVLPASAFARRATRSGRRTRCRDCVAAVERRRRAARAAARTTLAEAA